MYVILSHQYSNHDFQILSKNMAQYVFSLTYFSWTETQKLQKK